MTTVFQEQAMLLYAIAGLMLVLNVAAIGIWLRLGDIRDALENKPRDYTPKMSNVRVPPESSVGAYAYRGGKTPQD